MPPPPSIPYFLKLPRPNPPFPHKVVVDLDVVEKYIREVLIMVCAAEWAINSNRKAIEKVTQLENWKMPNLVVLECAHSFCTCK